MKFINLAPFEARKNYQLDQEKDLTILIKTLEREAHLVQLLTSIKKYGFTGQIIIADDSQNSYELSIKGKFLDLNILYITLPFNQGLSIGRNIMLEKVKTTYFLLCDDDFVFDRRARIPLMKKLLNSYNLDILGGVFLQHNLKTRIGKYLLRLNKYLSRYNWVLPSFQVYEYQAGFHIENEKISLFPVEYNDPVTACDLTHNFFLARTEKVKSFGGWNSNLKVGEHENFFIRAKLAGLKIGTTRKCGVIHDQWIPNSEEYKRLRNTAKEYQMIALEEFGLKRLENYSEVLGGKFGI